MSYFFLNQYILGYEEVLVIGTRRLYTTSYGFIVVSLNIFATSVYLN